MDPGSGDPSRPPRAPAVPGRRVPPTISPGRLPTIRSRDLTLGGVKKKTFTPNIIGRKTKEELKTDEGKKRDRRDADRGRQRDGRGRGRGRPEVIQSHSIFEQGPAEMAAKRRGGYDDAREAASSGPSPIINIKKERETEEETKEILLKLERDNFLDDPRLKGELKSCPVQLPLAVSGWVFQEPEEATPSVKLEESGSDGEVKVKQEPMEVCDGKKEAASAFRVPPLPEPELLPDLLESWSRRPHEELLFVQLPDSLPAQPPTTDVRPKAEAPPGDAQKTESQEEAPEDSSCCLKNLQEGLIGKMLVRKSGKVQLVLGSVVLDVSLGTPCSFLQELVSVNSEGRAGDLSVLGQVKHKLVCSPDFQALLDNRA